MGIVAKKWKGVKALIIMATPCSFITASRQRGEVDRAQEYQVLDSPQPVTAMMDKMSLG